MGKILVLFQSNTGNTAKMAELVAEGAGRVPDTEVRLRSNEEADVEDLKWCEGIALGAPTNFGTVPWKMKKWWDDRIDDEIWPYVDGKFGCSFSSAGSIGGGQELNCMTLNIILMNFGFLVFGLTDYTGPGLSAHYGVGQRGRSSFRRRKGSLRPPRAAPRGMGVCLRGSQSRIPSSETEIQEAAV